MIALLNRMGVKFDNSATDAQLLELINAIPAPTQLAQAPAAPAQPNPAPTNADPRITALESRITQLTEADNAARKLRIENRIDALISNDQVTKSEREKAIARALKDETYIDELSARPAMPPGGQPLGPSMDIEETGSSFKNVQEYILNNGPRLTSKFLGARNADRPMDRKTATDIRDCAIKSAMAVRKHNKMLVEMFNTNTIDAALQRTVILQELLRAYKLRVLPLRAFCTTFSNVPLEGTDTVTVPYFPLQATASTDWVAGNGYVTGNTTEQMKQVTVNKRKYQGMAFTSYEQRRQPYLNLQQLALMNAEKLAYDVNQDVLSIVTAANYGAAVKTTPAAAFTGDDVADLYGSATDLNWPDTGRSLVLTTGYKVALLKDPTFKQYLAYGATDPVRKAQIQEAYGFEDIYTVPTANFPANGQNLTGFITHKSAALVATAPIMPSPAVRMLMVQYDLVTDPDDGISLEYRLFGDAYFDKTNEIVEANYGYALGVAAALARITSA